MATQLNEHELNLQEQLASIKRHMAEIDQRNMQTKFEPRKFWVSAVLAAAGLLTAGAAAGGLLVSLFSS